MPNITTASALQTWMSPYIGRPSEHCLKRERPSAVSLRTLQEPRNSRKIRRLMSRRIQLWRRMHTSGSADQLFAGRGAEHIAAVLPVTNVTSLGACLADIYRLPGK